MERVPFMSVQAIKNWEIKPSTGGHFGVLDGIRGIAILMVVCYHTIYTNPHAGPRSRLVGLFFMTGGMGVPIFFVLSGFLIAHPFFRQREADRQSWYVKGYTRRRVGKILPPFYLSLVIFVSYYFLRFSNPAYLLAGLQWALGLSNFILPAADLHAPYWSLLVELHFYVFLPVLFFLFRGRDSRPVSLFIFALLFFVPLITRQLTWPAETVPRNLVGFLMNRFPCSLDFFAWGVLFAGFFASRPIGIGRSERLRYFGYAGIVFLMVSIAINVFCLMRFDIINHPQRWTVEAFHLLPSLSTFLLLFFLFDPNCLGTRFFSLPPLRFTGIISYEWFLFHQPVVVLFRDIFGDTHGNIALYLAKTILPLALTFAFSVAVYRYFSFPLMQWCRGDQSKKDSRSSGLGAQTASAITPLPVVAKNQTERN